MPSELTRRARRIDPERRRPPGHHGPATGPSSFRLRTTFSPGGGRARLAAGRALGAAPGADRSNRSSALAGRPWPERSQPSAGPRCSTAASPSRPEQHANACGSKLKLGSRLFRPSPALGIWRNSVRSRNGPSDPPLPSGPDRAGQRRNRHHLHAHAGGPGARPPACGSTPEHLALDDGEHAARGPGRPAFAHEAR